MNKADALKRLMSSMDVQKMMVDNIKLALKNSEGQLLSVIGDQEKVTLILDTFIKKVESRAHEMVAAVQTSYDTTYTLEEVVALAEFYGSPMGKTIMEKMPKAMSKGQQIGSKWGEALMQETAKELGIE